MSVRLRIRDVVMIASVTFVTACLPSMPTSNVADPAASAQGTTVDNATVLAAVANGQYRYSPQFVPVSHEAYTSAVATQSTINVWVDRADYAAYTRISPDATGSGASLAPGAMIIREVLDAQGAVGKLTLMVKGPAGYNPMVGDFWFGVTQPDGTPIVDNGAEKLGLVQDCFSCHIGRAGDGFLFGVPPAHRMGPVPPTLPPAADAGVPVHADGGVSDGGAPPSSASDMGTSSDMGKSWGDVCGDFVCGPTESCDSCASDCHCCGNGDRHGKSGSCK